MSTQTISRSEVRLFRIKDAQQALGLSRSVVFELLRSGRLRSVKQGRTRLIPRAALDEYVKLLETEADS
jgi:excisionase family DNA binding protein